MRTAVGVSTCMPFGGRKVEVPSFSSIRGSLKLANLSLPRCVSVVLAPSRTETAPSVDS